MLIISLQVPVNVDIEATGLATGKFAVYIVIPIVLLTIIMIIVVLVIRLRKGKCKIAKYTMA